MKPLKQGLKTGWELLSRTYEEFSHERAELLAAAMAFYTLLSIAPLLIIAVGIAGLVLGEGAARQEITKLMMNSMGPKVTATIGEWVDEAARAGGLASFVGIVLLLYAASRLVTQLRNVLNQIWNVDVFETEGFKASVKDFVQRRLFAATLVALCGPLLLAVVASRAILLSTHRFVFSALGLHQGVLQIVQLLFSLGIVAIITALVFKILPDAKVPWRPIWAGAALTSVLFNGGNVLVGLYLGRAGVAAAYGAAGSAIVVLLWLYFSSLFFLLGAEFTQVYANWSGKELVERRPGTLKDKFLRRLRARKNHRLGDEQPTSH